MSPVPDGSSSAIGACPPGSSSAVRPGLLQSATVPGVPPERLGIQQLPVHELGAFVQDSWHPHKRVTLDLGLRWDGTWHPRVFVEPEDTFFAPYLDDPRFPSNGRIPDDLDNLQPRLGLAWSLAGDDRTVLRANAGSYVARIPVLVFAQHRATNGAFQQTLFRSSTAPELGPVPRLTARSMPRRRPLSCPTSKSPTAAWNCLETWSFRAGIERDLGHGIAASVTYIQAPHRQPVPLRQPQRRGLRDSVRDRNASVRRRHQHADRRREQRKVTLPFPLGRAARPRQRPAGAR